MIEEQVTDSHVLSQFFIHHVVKSESGKVFYSTNVENTLFKISCENIANPKQQY